MVMNNYFKIKLIDDNLFVDTRQFNHSSPLLDKSSLVLYYSKRISNDVSKNIKKLTIYGLGTANSFLLRTEKILINEDINLNYIEIIDEDNYGLHLRTILELIVDKPSVSVLLNTYDKYVICLPDHFEAFNLDGFPLDSDTIISKLSDEEYFDRKNSSFLLVVGDSYDEEFKNPVKIIGLTQIKISLYQ